MLKKMISVTTAASLTALFFCACADGPQNSGNEAAKPAAPLKQYAGEAPVSQLTFGGKENSEAYFSPDNKTIIFQGQEDSDEQLEVYTLNLDTKEKKRLTVTPGKEVCTFFYPDGTKMLFSSTMSLHRPKDDFRYYGTMWPCDHSFEIYSANSDGAGIKRLTYNEYYEAETSFSPDGKKILFTSDREGNLELYVMNIDGTEQTRLTNTPDLHEGGAFFSPDGTMIVYRAWSAPATAIQPTRETKAKTAHIYVMNANGTGSRQVTKEECFNWSPYFMPDGKRIVFASNAEGKGNNELYMIDIDGNNLKRLTFFEGFDSYPVVSSDGKKMLFTSTRADDKPQVFIMDLPAEEPQAAPK